MSQEAYDIAIVGAGAAGFVAGSYLAEHTDGSIALIEAGDIDRDPFIHIPTGHVQARALALFRKIASEPSSANSKSASAKERSQ
jgi:choline dehydrogenase-like flavoprotein